MTARRIFGAAALVAALTILVRVAGFGRIVVFQATVGQTPLGEAYQAANTVPNILFELVAGGALASLVVPLLAGPAAREDRPTVSATVSALLTWVFVLLVPAAVLVALAANPLVRLLAPAGAPPEAIDAGTDMLRVFAPQIPLYGVGLVLTGVLQTYRRFAWPVIAPLLSSLTVTAAYVLFGVLAGRSAELGTVSTGELLVLSGGTTLAVAVLSLCLLVPLRPLDLRLRPRLRLDAEAVRTVRPLAVAGVITVGAQQLTVALSVALVWDRPAGALVLFTLAQTIFLLPWAVLALPVATTRYPALAEAGATGDRDRFASTLAPAVRTVLLLCCLGAAVLIAVADPIAAVMAVITEKSPPARLLAATIAWFAPGLLGYGLFALLSRALYARGDGYAAAGATALGWGSVAAAALVLAATTPEGDRAPALAAANSIGMLVLGAALFLLVRRRAGGASVAGAARTLAAGTAAAAAAVGAGLGVQGLIEGWQGDGTPGVWAALVQGMLCGVVVVVVFLAVAAMTDRHTLRTLARRRGGAKP